MSEKLRVLLVDDNPDDRTLAIRELRREFPMVEVREIINAEQFEEALQRCDFEVAITDYMLGWSDGIAILHALKAKCSEHPVIMFTATAKQEDAVAAMKAGLDEYVIKSPKHFVRLPVAVRATLEQTKQRQLLRESQRLALVGRLTATIMHEIANPLNSLLALLHLIENDPKAGAKSHELAMHGIAETSRIAEIMSRTLGFYKQATAPVSVNLPSLTDDVVALYTRRMEAANIVLERRYEYTEEIEAYPTEIRQLVSNLFMNALDAVRQNGRITIHIFGSRHWSNPDLRGVRLLIRDNGSGVSAENQRKIFDPFFTTKGEKGTGLGLWITQGIVSKHGGLIRLRSSTRLGRSGTCFSVFLPERFVAKAASA
jgi:signal transduction histidine kinase